jgi:hypothetical protein
MTRHGGARVRTRRLQVYPQGQSNQGTHLSVFLDSSPERAGNLEGLQKCEFTLTLQSAWDAADGSGSGDLVKGASPRARAPRTPLTRSSAHQTPCTASAPPLAPGARCGLEPLPRAAALTWRGAGRARRGFSEFMELPELNDAARGFIFDDDSVTIAVAVEVHTGLRAPLPPPVPTPAAVLGFEPELFAQQPVAEMMHCGVCLSVMNDPVSCQEGHKCAAFCAAACAQRR